MAERRRTFAPVVLLGLASATLAAVAGSRAWMDLAAGSGTADQPPGPAVSVFAGTTGESPLAAALALVVLACWGVVLVTRGAFRRGVAVLGVLAAAGFAATVAAAPWTLAGPLAEEIRRQTGSDVAVVELTAWWWAAVVAAVVSLVATVAAVRWTPHWPEMGARYDAPADPAESRDRTPETGIDMWKALDEGRDPTA